MLSSYLNSNQLADLTGQFSNLFATFSTGISNYVTVIKEPIKVIQNSSEQVLAGYGGENQNIQDVVYQPVTGIFPAVIIYPNSMTERQFGQLKFNLDENQISIKVDSTTADFLTRGKTERILVNDSYYNMEITPRVQNYFGLKYYYFKLTSTK